MKSAAVFLVFYLKSIFILLFILFPRSLHKSVKKISKYQPYISFGFIKNLMLKLDDKKLVVTMRRTFYFTKENEEKNCKKHKSRDCSLRHFKRFWKKNVVVPFEIPQNRFSFSLFSLLVVALCWWLSNLWCSAAFNSFCLLFFGINYWRWVTTKDSQLLGCRFFCRKSTKSSRSTGQAPSIE